MLELQALGKCGFTLAVRKERAILAENRNFAETRSLDSLCGSQCPRLHTQPSSAGFVGFSDQRSPRWGEKGPLNSLKCYCQDRVGRG